MLFGYLTINIKIGKKMIAFTICSNNYLGKAQVLLNSLKVHENVKVYLFLADQRSPLIDYLKIGFDKVISPEELEIPNLQWQLENYNIIEFNTALKGPAFKYLFSKTEANILYYFDPDIKVYQPLSLFNHFFNGKSILLTPHILEPIPFDSLFPGENLFLNHGIYNLGFLGLKRSEITDSFLLWWNERLANECFIDLKEGFFTDQIWINLVPLLFKDVNVIEHPGFNVAYWNLHDRSIEYTDNKIKVNKTVDLFFYHFSSFDPRIENLIPAENARFTFKNRKEMVKLYQNYLNDITKYNDIDYHTIKYYNNLYPIIKPINKRSVVRRIINKLLN